jgi:uncharacterized protein
MLSEPLPNQVDIRKLVTKGAEINAEFPLSKLTRFAGLLANTEGSITAVLRFFTDENKVQIVEGEVRAYPFVVCQRCLEPMPICLESHFELGLVRDDERAKQLPAGLDPLIVTDDLFNLADIVEEELILSLPYVNYHKVEDCQRQPGFSTGEFDPSLEKPIESPFKVLENLKSGKV